MTSRIAYLCSDPGIAPDGTKGASVHFRQMAAALVAEGATLDVVMARNGAPFLASGVRIVPAPKGKGPGREAALIAHNDRVLEALRAGGPHDAVYERLSTFGLAGARYATEAAIPLLVEVNAPLWIEAAQFRALQHVDAAREMALETLAVAARVLVVSRELGRILVDAGVDGGKIEVLPNRVDRAAFEGAVPYPRPAIFEDRSVMVFIGSLKPWHGIEFLLEAFDVLGSEPAVGLWIVGDGTLRGVVEAAAARRPVDIHYEGAVPHDAIPAILKSADFALAPYTSQAPSYFCPLKVIEAMAVSCPLLASDVTCVADVVPPEADVIQYVADDVASFRAGVLELCARPVTSRAGTVDERWSWARNATRVLELMARCLVLCALWLPTGCQNPDLSLRRSIRDLRPGMWVEIEGRREAGRSIAQNVNELPRSADAESDKMEVRGRVESTDGGSFRLLGRDIEIADKTGFEDLARAPVDPFELRPDDWVKVKLRIKDEGRLRARTIRRSEMRDQFEVEGELGRIDHETAQLFVGHVRLDTTPQTRVRLAGEIERKLDDPLALFLEDDQKSVPFTIRLTDRLMVGGQVTAGYRFDDELDLDRTDQGDRQRTASRGKLDLLWVFDDRGSFGLLEGSYSRNDRQEVGDPDTTTESASLSRAYVYYRFSDALRFQVGRQDFDDEREWLYDEVLDGLRVHVTAGAWDFEVGAAAGREFAEEAGNPTEETATYSLLARYNVDDDHRLTAYLIERRDASLAEFEPRLFGLRSFSRPGRGLGHWVELARAEGRDGALTIEGEAFDVGAMYRFDIAWSPTVYAGYAYARGEDRSLGRSGFRQTGLQDNNAKFGGVASFRYYGELFEPELANIDISTVGFGVRPSRGWSLDVIAHGYRQDFKSSVANSDNLRASPNGVHSTLGFELDVVVGYRYESRLRGALVLSRFEPGPAFDRQDPAHRVEVQVRVGF